MKLELVDVRVACFSLFRPTHAFDRPISAFQMAYDGVLVWIVSPACHILMRYFCGRIHGITLPNKISKIPKLSIQCLYFLFFRVIWIIFSSGALRQLKPNFQHGGFSWFLALK